jgi:hypothetical protein
VSVSEETQAQTQDKPKALDVHVGAPTQMFRLNGIGTTVMGALRDPSISPWYFKQYAFTVLLIPIWMGRFYLVKDTKKRRTWRFAGWLSGAEIIKRYGAGAYWGFKLRALAFPVIVWGVIFGVMAYAASQIHTLPPHH